MHKEFHKAHRNGKKTGYLRRATPACVRQELSCEMATMIRRASPESIFNNVGHILRHHGRTVAAMWNKLMTIDESRLMKIQLMVARRAEKIPGATPHTVDVAVKEAFYVMLVNAMVHTYTAGLINPGETAFRMDQGIGRSSKETVWFMSAAVMGRMLAPSRTGVVFGHVLRYVYTAATLLVGHRALKVHVERCLTLRNVVGSATERFVPNDVAIRARRVAMIDRALIDCQRIVHDDPERADDVLREMRAPQKLRYYQAVVPVNTRPECAKLVASWIASKEPVCPTLYSDANPATSMAQTSPAAKAVHESPLPPVLGAGAVTEAAGEFILCVGHNKVEAGRGWPAAIPKFDRETMAVAPDSMIMTLRNANPPTGRIDSAAEPSKLERLLAGALRAHIETGPLKDMFVRIGDKPAYRSVRNIETQVDALRVGDGVSAPEFRIDAEYANVAEEKRAHLKKLHKAAVREALADAGTVMKMPQYVRKDLASGRQRKSKKIKLEEETQRAADEFEDAMPTFPQDDLLGGEDFGDLMMLGEELDVDAGEGEWASEGVIAAAAAAAAAPPTIDEMFAILPPYQPDPVSPAVVHAKPELDDATRPLTQLDGVTAIEARKHGLTASSGPVGMMDTRELVKVIARCEGTCKLFRGGYVHAAVCVDNHVVRAYHLERAATQLRIVYDRNIQVNHADGSAGLAGDMAANIFATMATTEVSLADQITLIQTLIQTYPSVFIAPATLEIAPAKMDDVSRATTSTPETVRAVAAARQVVHEFMFSTSIPNGAAFELDAGDDFGGIGARVARACQHAVMLLSVGTVGGVQRTNVLGGVLTMGKVHPSAFLNRRLFEIVNNPGAATVTGPVKVPVDIPHHPIATDPMVEAVNMISQPALSMLGDVDAVTRYFGGQAKMVIDRGVVSDGVVYDAVHRLLLESEVPSVRFVGGDPADPAAWGLEGDAAPISLLGKEARVRWIYVCIEHPVGGWLAHTVGEIRLTVTLADGEPLRYIRRVFDLDFAGGKGHKTLYRDIFGIVVAMAGGEAWDPSSHTSYAETLAKASDTTLIDPAPELVDGTFMAALRLSGVPIV